MGEKKYGNFFTKKGMDFQKVFTNMVTVYRKYMKTVDIQKKLNYDKATIQLVARICLLVRML